MAVPNMPEMPVEVPVDDPYEDTEWSVTSFYQEVRR